jgi:hypothetical protein
MKDKECVHTQLHEADEKLIDFTDDSEYQRIFEEHTEAMKQQKEKRPPPMPPKSPYK